MSSLEFRLLLLSRETTSPQSDEVNREFLGKISLDMSSDRVVLPAPGTRKPTGQSDGHSTGIHQVTGARQIAFRKTKIPRRRAFFWSPILLATACSVLFASQASYGESLKDSTADVLLAQTLEAHGGRSLQVGLRIRGSLIEPSDGAKIGTFTLVIRGDDFAFTSVQGGKAVALIKLHDHGHSRQDGITKHLLNSSDLTVDIIPQFAAWTRFNAEPSAATRPTPLQREGQTMTEITIEVQPRQLGGQRNPRTKQTVVINPATGLLYSYSYPAAGGVTVTNNYSEYRDFQGTLLPTRILKSVGERIKILYAIDEAARETETTISDAELTAPLQ